MEDIFQYFTCEEKNKIQYTNTLIVTKSLSHPFVSYASTMKISTLVIVTALT